jgi:two-component system copper resistance phosphate regulon response regulator CusR
MRLLVVEDEAKLARQLQEGLQSAGFEVALAATGESGLRAVLETPPHAAIVDVMLPGFSGLELVRAMRARGVTLPVLFLSARDATADRVRGFDEGGDDYLGKPFAFPELLARVRALLRRSSAPSIDAVVRVADLEWDPGARRIERQGRRIDLTPKEYTLAALLLERRGEVVARAEIVRCVWQLEFEPPGNTVDVQVRRLRAKLDEPFEPKLVHTLRGLGYVLEDRS